MIVYASVFCALLSTGIYRFIKRSEVHLMIVSPTSRPYFLDQDRVKNMFNIKVTNQSEETDKYSLSTQDGTIETPTLTSDIAPGQEIFVPVVVSNPAETKTSLITIKVRSEFTGKEYIIEKPFLRPGKVNEKPQFDLP